MLILNGLLLLLNFKSLFFEERIIIIHYFKRFLKLIVVI